MAEPESMLAAGETVTDQNPDRIVNGPGSVTDDVKTKADELKEKANVFFKSKDIYS